MDFDEFYNKILSCKPIDILDKNIDMTISVSVLEHLDNNSLNKLLKTSFKYSKNNSIYFHSVDFGHHQKGSKDLDRLYRNSIHKKIPTINLLRKSDIFKIFESLKFGKNFSFTYRYAKFDPSIVHNTWKKYSDDDLASRVVFFVGKK